MLCSAFVLLQEWRLGYGIGKTITTEVYNLKYLVVLTTITVRTIRTKNKLSRNKTRFCDWELVSEEYKS